MSQADSPNTMSPSRRTVLAGISVAVAPAVAAVDKSLGAVAFPDDPIFAAIEAYDRSVERKVALQNKADDVHAALPDEHTTWSMNVGDGRWPPEECGDAPEWIDLQLAIGEAIEKQCDLEIALLTTAPTTIEGAAALLDRLADPEFLHERGMGAESLLSVAGLSYDERVQDAAEAFPAALATALRKIAAAQASL
jgi:hypothetical protein